MAGTLRIFLVALILTFITTTYAQTSTTSSAVSNTPSTCSPAGITALRACYQLYLATLNLPFDGAAPTYQNYVDTRQFAERAGGVQGFTKICQAISTLHSCVSPIEQSCLNVDAFQQALNVSRADAYSYVALYGADKWTCYDGFQLVADNLYCIEAVFYNHLDEFNNCNNIFATAAQQNNIDCSMGSTFATCAQNFFQTYCLNAGAVFGCQFARGSVVVFNSACNTQMPSCPTPTSN
uniref:Uncharacterized protein n=1 Tax=Acrobeloides nanus TaxID=290746 RepID=A0A914DCV6_9BILA